MNLDGGVVICCCADGTLTVWRKSLGWQKPIQAALPCFACDDPDTAESLIREVTSPRYDSEEAALAQDRSRMRPVVTAVPFEQQSTRALFEVARLLEERYERRLMMRWTLTP